MNQLNETLAIIRRQKTIYMLKLKDADVKLSEELKKKISELDKEEQRILKELGVSLDGGD